MDASLKAKTTSNNFLFQFVRRLFSPKLACKRNLKITICCILFVASSSTLAQFGSTLNQAASGLDMDLSDPVRYLIVIGALSFIPAFVIAATAFTRIIVVLSMLRLALGLQTTPPNIVLITLALFMTVFAMGPVISDVNKVAVQPYLNEDVDFETAINAGALPFKEFMVRHTEESDLRTIVEMAKESFPSNLEEIQMFHLVPAFMLSELRTAFKMGFVLFLPFILIDILVASILMGLGMIMVPPMTISLPLKVLVFVLSDGWLLLSESLLLSFS